MAKPFRDSELGNSCAYIRSQAKNYPSENKEQTLFCDLRQGIAKGTWGKGGSSKNSLNDLSAFGRR